MKRLLCTVFALSLLGGTAAMADPHDHDSDHHDYSHDSGHDWDHYDSHHQHDRPHWNRGDTFRGHYVVVDDWRGHHLRRPPHGYRWERTDDGDFILAAIGTGVILDLMFNH